MFPEEDMAKYYDQKALARNQRYINKSCISVNFRLNKNTEPELIEIYKRIPNSMKASIFKKALEEWGREHPE